MTSHLKYLLVPALLSILVKYSLANEVDEIKQMLNTTLERIKELEQWKNAFDSGHTAWVMRAGNLIHLLCVPGLALFYGGMAQVKDVLSTVFQTFSITCFVSLLWFFMGYSLALGDDSTVLGGAHRFWLMGYSNRISVDSQHALAPGIPESTYFVFQMGVANLTAVIVCSSFAERMRFRSMLAFLLPWHLLVYCPVAHAVWARAGFLRRAGALDFAGGGVAHVCAGFSALAAALAVGPRAGFAAADMRPHNAVHALVGACLVWVGWLGFNGGSRFAADGRAGFAAAATHVAAATCAVAWMLLEWRHRGRPSVLGIASGAVAGLVAITPGCGYVDQTGAMVTGLVTAPIVYFGIQLKRRAGHDDAAEAFTLHGLGGVVGGVLTGFFANDAITGAGGEPDPPRGVFYGDGWQLGRQLYALAVIAGWSFAVSYALLRVIAASPLRLRVNDAGPDRDGPSDSAEDLDFAGGGPGGAPGAAESTLSRAAAAATAALAALRSDEAAGAVAGERRPPPPRKPMDIEWL